MTPERDSAPGNGPVTCVIASDRPWNRAMAQSLAARTGATFVHIADPAQLTAQRLAAIGPRFVFFPHWSHRIDATVHERFECVMFHMTDLPFGRGGSPLQNLIVRGIGETRISAFRCVHEMDAGPVYLKRPLALHGSAQEILLRAAGVIEDMIVELLHAPVVPVPQSGTPTVFRRRRPEDGDLIAASSLGQVFDMIRMLDAEGYPPAFLNAGPFTLEFSGAALEGDSVVAKVRFRLAGKSKEGSES